MPDTSTQPPCYPLLRGRIEMGGGLGGEERGILFFFFSFFSPPRQNILSRDYRDLCREEGQTDSASSPGDGCGRWHSPAKFLILQGGSSLLLAPLGHKGCFAGGDHQNQPLNLSSAVLWVGFATGPCSLGQRRGPNHRPPATIAAAGTVMGRCKGKLENK